jgi:hypothetical protein
MEPIPAAIAPLHWVELKVQRQFFRQAVGRDTERMDEAGYAGYLKLATAIGCGLKTSRHIRLLPLRH